MNRLAALLIAVLWAGAASAQGAREVRGAQAGDFDFYVLALTWSPGFCALEGDRKGRPQCEPGRRIGFTVHGLWPQYERGFPTECGPADRSPSRIALNEARDVFPDEGLARHEWRQHGTCSGKSPAAYFADVRRARGNIRIPERFQAPAGDEIMNALDIERAFAEANAGLRLDMMSVACRRGVLQEVRICMNKDLRGFRRCPEVDRSGCRLGDIRIDAAR